MTMPKHEPAAGIGGSITAILYALFMVLKAADVGVTDEMTDGITALVLALCAVPAIGGFITRFFVYAPATVEKIAERQYTAGTPPTEPQPEIPPPGTV
jgi:hypothetical protein